MAAARAPSPLPDGAPAGYALFDTPVGRCGVAWSARGLRALQLPEATDDATRARLRARVPGVEERRPTPAVRRVLAALGRVLAGARDTLEDVALDFEGLPAFHVAVYRAARAVPPGETATYGAIAERLGSPGAARAVGQALGRNPFALVVPCHRVTAAGGRLGGFSAAGGLSTKRRLLALEGAGPTGLFDAPPAAVPYDAAAALRHLRDADPKLAPLLDAVPFTLTVEAPPSVFFALAESVVYQQLTGKAAATIFGRVRALVPGRRGLTPEGLDGVSDAALRGAGLSGNKLLALRDLAARARAGELPTFSEAGRLDDETLVERLTAVRGIGRWSVEMLLLFKLGRPDVLPLGDYGVQQGFLATFGRPRTRPDATPAVALREALRARGRRWAPYRSVASWYMWRALERARGSAGGGRA